MWYFVPRECRKAYNIQYKRARANCGASTSTVESRLVRKRRLSRETYRPTRGGGELCGGGRLSGDWRELIRPACGRTSSMTIIIVSARDAAATTETGPRAPSPEQQVSRGSARRVKTGRGMQGRRSNPFRAHTRRSGFRVK